MDCPGIASTSKVKRERCKEAGINIGYLLCNGIHPLRVFAALGYLNRKAGKKTEFNLCWGEIIWNDDPGIGFTQIPIESNYHHPGRRFSCLSDGH